MRPSVMVASVMEQHIKMGRKCLEAGVHHPGVLETLQILNDVRKVVENFEASIMADIMDID